MAPIGRFDCCSAVSTAAMLGGITGEINAVEEQSHLLRQQVEELESILGPVLVPNPPTVASNHMNSAAPPEARSDLAIRLSLLISSIMDSRLLLQNIVGRVDLR